MWEPLENLDDSHAAKMVQGRQLAVRNPFSITREGSRPVLLITNLLTANRYPLDCYNRRLVLLVRSLEISDLVVALEVPDAGRDFIDQIVIVGDE